MMRINLLPYRAAARQDAKRRFVLACLLAVAGASGLAAAVQQGLQVRLADQRHANRLIEQAQARAQRELKEKQRIEADRQDLQGRWQTLQALQAQRHLPVLLLDALAHAVPDGAHLSGLRRVARQVTLVGRAQSSQTVSQLLDHLAHRLPWSAEPQLLELKAVPLALAGAPPQQVYAFSVQLQLPAEQTPDSPAVLGGRP